MIIPIPIIIRKNSNSQGLLDLAEADYPWYLILCCILQLLTLVVGSLFMIFYPDKGFVVAGYMFCMVGVSIGVFTLGGAIDWLYKRAAKEEKNSDAK